LYNLYRQNYINPQMEQTRIINSNDQIQEKLEKLKKEQARALRADAGEGFQEGLLAEEVYVEEEPQISLEEIQAEADRMIEEARAAAERIVQDAKDQADIWQKQAETEGYDAGQKQGLEEAKKVLDDGKQELETQRMQMEQEYQAKYRELEPQLLDTVLTVVERVFHAQFDNRKDILLSVIEDTMEEVENAKEFRIRMTPENCSFLKAHRQEIEMKVGMNSELEFVPDVSLGLNQCLIETDSGVFDCSLDVQLNNLIRELRSLCVS